MAGSSILSSSSSGAATNTFPAVSQPQNSANSITNCTNHLLRFRPQSQACHTCSGGTIGPAASTYPDDDDIHSLLQILPHDVCDNLLCDSKIDQLLEVTQDLGRLPQACYNGDSGRRYLRKMETELEYAQRAGTLHRISAIRNKNGKVVGLTCGVGRPRREEMDMVRDLLAYERPFAFQLNFTTDVSTPEWVKSGVGKTTVKRGISSVFSDEFQKRVVIVDTSNEIGGDGDIPHPAIGRARRLQVSEPYMQYKVMIEGEAVENHMPEVIIVDKIGTEAEVCACLTITQRGVMLIGIAHGKKLRDIIKNPTLNDLIGGLETVILSDQEARTRYSRKSILERRTAPTFSFLIEMREKHSWMAHLTDKSVHESLHGKKPLVEVRHGDKQFKVVIERWKTEV